MARRGHVVLVVTTVVAVLVGTLLLVREARSPTGGTPVAVSGPTGTVQVAPPSSADPVTAPALTPTPTPQPASPLAPTPETAPAPQTPPTSPAESVTDPEPSSAAPSGTTPAAGAALPELVAPYSHVQGGYGSDKVAYLTFDDGPGPNTPAVLDILDAAGVRATFCQVGNQIDAHPDTERRLIAAGHTLCNHSWSHPARMDTAGAAVIADEMTRTQDAFARFGVTSRYFRAPGGSFGTDDPTLRRVGQQNSLIPLGWEVDSEDWRKPGARQIADTVLGSVGPGAVILLHDAGGTDRDQTLAALPLIISGLRAAGYDLQPLPPGGF